MAHVFAWPKPAHGTSFRVAKTWRVLCLVGVLTEEGDIFFYENISG